MVTREQLRAVGAGYGVGVGCAIAALVLGLAAAVVAAVLGLSLEVRIGLLFVFGQYLPFIGLPVAYLAWRGMDGGAIREYLGVRVPSLREVGVVVVGYLGLLGLVAGTIWVVVGLLGLDPASNSAGEVAQEFPRIIPLFIVGSLLVIGPSEETLFRGVVQSRLREALSAAPAILLTAALFASIHVTALTGGLSARAVTIVILFVPSLVFGVVYEYTDNLVVPAVIHGAYNATLFASILLSESMATGWV